MDSDVVQSEMEVVPEESKARNNNSNVNDNQQGIVPLSIKTTTMERPVVALRVGIRNAADVEDLRSHYMRNNIKPHYYVIYWVDPQQQFRTNAIRGWSYVWNYVSDPIFLGRDFHCYEYLYLEVIRVGPRTEPGTSTGMALIARGRVPLPEEFNPVANIVDMVRLHEDGQHKFQGTIQVSLKFYPLIS